MDAFVNQTGTAACTPAGAVELPIKASERARHREIASYLEAASFPRGTPLGLPDTPRMNEDDVINALMERGLLKLDCDRSFLSLIDHQYQFICGEVANDYAFERHEEVTRDNAIYLGLSKHELQWGVCPTTMKVFTDETGEYVREEANVIANRSCYIINDFRSDPMFREKPFVVGFPFMVSYLEVPLISPGGYVLGSYCVVDKKLRNFNDPNILRVMADIANSIMSHLELVRLKKIKDRSERMVTGLRAFICQDSTVPNLRVVDHSVAVGNIIQTAVDRGSSHHQNSVEILREDTENAGVLLTSARSSNASENFSSDQTKLGSERGSFTSSTSTDWDQSTPLSTPLQLAGQDPIVAYSELQIQPTARAAPPAGLSRPDSVPITTDAQHPLLSYNVKNIFSRAASTIQQHMDMDGFMFLDANPSNIGDLFENDNNDTRYPLADDMQNKTPDTASERCDILAQALRPSKTRSVQNASTMPSSVPSVVLRQLVREFPRGHVFSADEHGPIDTRYGPSISLDASKKLAHAAPQLEGEIIRLFSILPEARYIIFLPLWHFKRECWFAAGLGWVTDVTQAIDVADINLVSAFGNSVMAEILQAESHEVSKAKSDFISSLSHELRSPLHGILASGELLREVVTDPSATPMLDMIDSCATTLFDTFNNLLDYAKLDNITGARKQRENQSENMSSVVSQPSVHTVTNMSQLLQDMAEAVFLSHSSKTAFIGLPYPTGAHEQGTGASPNDPEGTFNPPVLVAVDVEQRHDWTVTVDVGAWKRIITNLFSNALKYTTSGTITLSLKLVRQTDAKGTPKSQICLLIKDTGRGMSLDYLTYQLFTPFAQENALSPGTGLGLSIVQKLVKNLGGTLNVQSQLGLGTHVRVLAPIDEVEADRISGSEQSAKVSSSFPVDHLTKNRVLCHIPVEAYTSLKRSNHPITIDMQKRSRLVYYTLKSIAEHQLGMKVNTARSDAILPEADIYFVDAYISDIAELPLDLLAVPCLIVLGVGSKMFRCDVGRDALGSNVSILRQPITPTKLSSSIWEALRALNHQGSKTENIISGRSIELMEVAHETSRIYKEGQGESDESKDSDSSITEIVGIPSVGASEKGHILSIQPIAIGAEEHLQQHLLLVDDNQINLAILTALAKKLGHTFVTASDGLEAVQAYQTTYQRQQEQFPSSSSAKRAFDVVFMDVSMPRMNGFQAGREIRKFENSVGISSEKRSYIIALTGLGDELSKQEARRSGLDLFLMKPAKLKDIKEVLENINREDIGRVLRRRSTDS